MVLDWWSTLMIVWKKKIISISPLSSTLNRYETELQSFWQNQPKALSSVRQHKAQTSYRCTTL